MWKYSTLISPFCVCKRTNFKNLAYVGIGKGEVILNIFNLFILLGYVILKTKQFLRSAFIGILLSLFIHYLYPLTSN